MSNVQSTRNGNTTDGTRAKPRYTPQSVEEAHGFLNGFRCKANDDPAKSLFFVTLSLDKGPKRGGKEGDRYWQKVDVLVGEKWRGIIAQAVATDINPFDRQRCKFVIHDLAFEPVIGKDGALYCNTRGVLDDIFESLTARQNSASQRMRMSESEAPSNGELEPPPVPPQREKSGWLGRAFT